MALSNGIGVWTVIFFVSFLTFSGVFSDTDNQVSSEQKISIETHGTRIVITLKDSPPQPSQGLMTPPHVPTNQLSPSSNPCDQLPMIKYCKSCIQHCNMCPNFYASGPVVTSMTPKSENTQEITEMELRALISEAVEKANQEYILSKLWSYLTNFRSVANLVVCCICGVTFIICGKAVITLATQFEDYVMCGIIMLFSLAWPYVHRGQQRIGEPDFDTCPVATFVLTFWKIFTIPTLWIHPIWFTCIIICVLVWVYADNITTFLNYIFP